MRDLDSMIAGWRRAMKRGGIRSRDELDELEGHLRDDIEHRMSSGMEAERAFALAVERMGAPRLLRDEFQKVQSHQIMNPKLKEYLIAILVAAIHFALLLPIVQKWKAGDAFVVWDYVILAVLATAMIGGAIIFTKKRRLKA